MRTLVIFAMLTSTVCAEIGDPQVKTDHPWYPGELAISNFERLAATQAAVYARETGRAVESDHDKALASWYWRNLHYAHCAEGTGDYFDAGFTASDWNREYWHGLFAHGFSLCGTTHSQWSAEMNALLGHARSRSVGVTGHSSFEVYLTGGAYGRGQWALLDHDVSTVIFDESGKRLLSIAEIKTGDKRLRDNNYQSARQNGWRIAGLYEKDVVGLYDEYASASYLSGYAGPPPTVHLRRGESLRRYANPGLEDGETFVFWGLNRRKSSGPGPARDRAWVNQPEKMHGAQRDAGSARDRVRFANAVYTYRPRFNDDSYREGVVAESEQQVTFEFNTPYVIAAQPPNDQPWAIYDDGCTEGLIVRSRRSLEVSVSTDCGQTWMTKKITDGLADFTDQAKGHKQYLVRIMASPNSLTDAALSITTVCQMNAAVIPRLRSGRNKITYAASGVALDSAGPNRDQANAHVHAGALDSADGVTLRLATPRGEPIVALFAASHNQSGNPPTPGLSYSIDYSDNRSSSWEPVISDWKIERREPEPPDLWSQSFAYGAKELEGRPQEIDVRFRNSEGKPYRRVESHLLYEVSNPTSGSVTFSWIEDGDRIRQSTHQVRSGHQEQTWAINTTGQVVTRWVEISAP